MIGFGRVNRARNGLLRRATAIIAATALFYMPLFAYAPAAQATDYTGTNGQDGGYAPNYGQGGSGGTGGTNGNGGSAAGGGGGGGFSGGYPGGGGGGADGGGGGGTYYGTNTGTGGGGGAGGAGYILSDGSTFTSSGNVTGGTGGGGGSGLADYSTPNQAGGGGGGGGGGSGIVVQGSGTITNTNTITAGDGGYAGGTAAYNPNLNGHPGAGGYGIRADSSTGVTIYNSGTITGGDAGESTSQGIINIGNAGIYGQYITLYNTGGTIVGGFSNGGATNAAAIEITNGMNALHLSGGTIATQIYGDGIKLDGGTSSVELNGGLISTTQNATGIDIINGTNTITLSSGQISLGQAGTGLLIGGGNNTFTMTGGSIYSVDSGQNIQNYGNAIIVNGGTTTFNISGGSLNAGADGNGGTHVVQFHGGTNTLNVSGTASLSGNYVGDVITANGGINTVNISGGTVKPGSDGPYAINFSGGTNIINVTGGTVGKIYLGGGANTLEGSGFSDIVTLGSGATAKIVAAGSDVSGITTFDNFGGLTIDSGRSLTVSTFTNESSGTLTLNSGAQLIASTLNLLDGSTIAGAGTLSNGANPLTLSGGSISATVGGTGGLVKSGTGTLTLTGANTYTGGTTVNGGTLSIAYGALGGGDVTLAEGTTIHFGGSSFTTTNDFHITGDPVFDVADGTTQTVSGVIDDATGPSDPGVVEKTGGGTLILSGANTYSGGTTIEAGVLQIGTDPVFNTPGDPASGLISSALGTGTLTFGGGTLQASDDTVVANAIDLNTASGAIDANGFDISLTGLISGTHGLSITSSGPSTVTFANASNSFSGGIGADSSGLMISESANGDFGSGPVTLTDGSGIEFTGADTYTNAVNVSGDTTFDLGGNAVTYNGLIADGTGGAGAVTVTGGGTLTLKNTANSYTGGTHISGGSTVSIDSDGELGGTAGGVTLGDATTTGTLALTQNVTSARTITLSAGGGAISASFGKTLTLSGQLTGSGGLTVSGPGGVFLTGNSNNYSGGTTIASGYVTAGRANVLGTGSLAIKAAGLLDLNNRSQSITSLSDGGDTHGGTIANSAGGTAVLTIGSDNSDSAFSGVIQSGSGNISLVKVGTGTLALSGANTYGGGTTLSAGTLQMGTDSVFNTPGNLASGIVSSAIGTGALTLDGGTLAFGGSYTLANNISLTANGGTIDAVGGLVELSGDITGSGPITLTSSAHYPGAYIKLGGDNTYSGTTTISAGRVMALSSTALSANSDYSLVGTSSGQDWPQIILNGYSQTIKSISGNYFTYGITNNGSSNATLTIAPGSGSTTDFGGGISNGNTGHTLAIVLDGASNAKQIFSSGSNTYTGGTTITSGILGVGADNALGTGVVTLNGGTLEAEGDHSLYNAIVVNGTGGTIDANGHTFTFSNGILDGLNGNSGTLTFASTGGAGTIDLNGTSSYQGAVVISSGATVVQGASGATLPGSSFTVNGELDVVSATITTLSGTGTISNNSDGAGHLTLSIASGNTSFGGTLADNANGGSLALTKSGAGTLTLSGSNSYSGGTTISAGTLAVADSNALGTGQIALNGGTLHYADTVDLANDVKLGGNAALDVTGTDSATQSGTISDNGSAHTLQKTGTGTLKLAAANTYSGTTKLTEGTLELGDADALGTSELVFDGGTLKVDGSYTIANDVLIDANGGTFDTNAFDTILSGTVTDGGSGGALAVSGSGTLTITGVNELAGGTDVAAGGTLVVGSGLALGSGTVTLGTGAIIKFANVSSSFSNDFTLDGDPTYDVASGLTTTLNGVISDDPLGSPGVLEKTGAGTLVLAGANTYSGGTTLTGGILRVGIATVGTPGSITSSAIGTGALTLDGGTLQAGGDYTVANAITVDSNNGGIDANGHLFELSGVIDGGGVLTITDSAGGGAVKLSGANTYAGGTIVDGATVLLASTTGMTSGPLGTGTVTLTNGGTLQATFGEFYNNDIGLDANGGALVADGNIVSFLGDISDGGTPGGLTINASGDTGTVYLSGNNTYTGGTTIAGGTVGVNSDNALGDSSGAVVVDDGATIAYADTVSVANTIILAGDGTLDVENGNSATQSGDIIENNGITAGFTKIGDGILILSGGSSYTGATIISAGTLELAAANAGNPDSDYTVNSGATLSLDGSLGNVYIGSLADGADGGGSVSAGAGTNLYVGGVIASMTPNSSDTTFSGDITADELAYSGAGTLTLTGNSNAVGTLVLCSCVSSGGIKLSGNTMTVTNVDVESGTLTVSGGAALSTTDLTVTGGGSADAAVLVSGSASSLSVTDTAIIGSVSAGTLTVANGATLTAPGVEVDNGSMFNVGNGGAAPVLDSSLATISSSDGAIIGSKVVGNFTGSFTLAAQLTGKLGLEAKAGNLTINNSGSNYTGATTIDSGATLTVGDATHNGTLSTSSVTDNGTLIFNNGLAAQTLTNIINGSGALKQNGVGAITITTVTGYSGATTVGTGATLRLTGNGAIAGSAEVVDHGTFDISGVNASANVKTLSGDGTVLIGSKTLNFTDGSTTFSGTITDGGAGGSVNFGGGNQILTGTNSWTGTTIIDADATVTVGSPASLGGSSLIFYPGSTLKFTAGGTFTQDADFAAQGAPIYDTGGTSVTWAGKLTGVGDLAVTGGGKLTLTNITNDYQGGTEVYGAATLKIDADSELGAVAPLQLGDATTRGTLQYGAAFTLDAGRAFSLNAGGGGIDTNGFDIAIGQVIGGAGGLTKLGAGVLTLSAANTYTGATSVKAGTLLVNGSIASSAVSVASGGTLSGKGTVGATTVASGGTVAPGSNNKLHVSGALTMANGSTTAIAVTPATSGQIVATGTAALDGTLAISQGAGTYKAGSSFVLVSASSLSGTFDSVTGDSFAGVASTIVYSAKNVELDLAKGSGTGTKFLFGTYGKTPNQIAAGNALAAGNPSGALYIAMGGVVSADTAAVPGALGQIAGDIHASLRSAAIEDSRMMRDSVLERMNVAKGDAAIWASAFDDHGSIDSDGNASKLNHNNAGFLIGADMPVAEGFRVGAAAGYTSNDASTGGRLSTASGNSAHVLAYAGWSDGTIDLKLGGDYGWGNVDVTRHVVALSGRNNNSEHQQTGQIFGEAGYIFVTDDATLEPYAGLANISARTGGFAEKGSVSALSGGGKSESETYSTLGIRASLPSGLPLGDLVVVPRLDIGWQHAFDHFTPDDVLTLQNAAQKFTVMGVPLDSDAAIVQLGVGIPVSDGVTLDVGYDGAFSGSRHDNAVRGELHWTF